MSEKKYRWYKAANSMDELSFSSNGMTELEVGGKTICVVKKNESVLACTKKCPHAGGTMAHGSLDALGNIICPIHRYKFSLLNGRNVSGEGYFLKTFPIEIRKEGVFVGFEENNLFNW